MKKLVLMFAAIAAVSFASCGNKAADAAKAQADSIRIADSIAAAQEMVESVATVDSTAAGDSLTVTETETEVVAE